MPEHSVPITADDLVDKLLPHVSAPRGWEIVGRRALARSKRVPVPTFMCVGTAFEITDTEPRAGLGL
jgi:hypothetical protein